MVQSIQHPRRLGGRAACEAVVLIRSGCACGDLVPTLIENLVPSSSEKMLNKSLVTKSDVIVYDLEDSVPPSAADKNGARNRLAQFIQVSIEYQYAHHSYANSCFPDSRASLRANCLCPNA